MTCQTAERKLLIDGLRALADFYECHHSAYYDGTRLSLAMYLSGRRARHIMTGMAHLFGNYEETQDEKHASVFKHFSRKVSLEIFAPRSALCRRVVVGERREGEILVPATKEIRVPERVVEVFAWECAPLIPRKACEQTE